MQSPPSPLGPFPRSAATGGSEHHILWPAPRKTGAVPQGKQAQGVGSPGWPQPPSQGLPTSWLGTMLGCWYPLGLPWERLMTLLSGWQRDQEERGKCPGEKISRNRKLVTALRGKAENSVVSPCPPQPATKKPSPKRKPFLNIGDFPPTSPCSSPMGPPRTLAPHTCCSQPHLFGGPVGAAPHSWALQISTRTEAISRWSFIRKHMTRAVGNHSSASTDYSLPRKRRFLSCRNSIMRSKKKR